MDPNQTVGAVAEHLNVSSDAAYQMLGDAFYAYSTAAPSDWSAVQQMLESVSEYSEPLNVKLQELATASGSGEHPSDFFEDHELQNYFTTASQGTETDQVAGEPVFEGSAIYKVGDNYYLGLDQQHQVWPADDFSFYYDQDTNYDAFGRPEEPEAQPSDAGQPQQKDIEKWNSFLADNGPLWDGTEESWQQFRDWFLYHANDNQVGETAQGFISYAESGDKRSVFTSYGITLPAAAPPASSPVPPEIHARVADFMKKYPDHANNLTDEDIAEVLEQFLAEQPS